MICCRNELIVPRHKRCSAAGVLSVSQPHPSVWNSLADLLDPAPEPIGFRRQLRTFLFAHHSAQGIEHIRAIMTMRIINFLFTQLR